MRVSGLLASALAGSLALGPAGCATTVEKTDATDTASSGDTPDEGGQATPADPRLALRDALGEPDPKKRAVQLEGLHPIFESDAATADLIASALVQTYAELHEVDRMRTWSRQVPVREDGNYADVLNAMAYAYSETGTDLAEASIRIAQALEILDRLEARMKPFGAHHRLVAGLDSRRAAYLDTRGWIRFRQGDLPGAESDLRAALERMQDSEIHYHLGVVLAARELPAEAAASYAAAVALGGRGAPPAREALEGMRGTLDVDAIMVRAQQERAEAQLRAVMSRAIDRPFPALALSKMAGKPIEASDVARGGQVTVVWLWATWCRPCLEELPQLEALYAPYRDSKEVRFLGINVDADADVGRRFLEHRKSPLPMTHGPMETTLGAFGVRSLPALFVVGLDGRIRFYHRGFDRKLSDVLPVEIEALRSAAKRPASD